MDHGLEKIVVGNEPAGSKRFGSHVTTHGDNDAISPRRGLTVAGRCRGPAG
jgi:hypothetical protein